MTDPRIAEIAAKPRLANVSPPISRSRAAMPETPLTPLTPLERELCEMLEEAANALESARVFIQRETGCRNPYRDAVLADTRAMLAKAKDRT